ncbi:helix-turn-helix domain-containing protein [Massilia sp. erpn]|uniref:helix-turn-helix domain-containing protein n=1 Tax=Massilia sp. erpn TaxID=2738142 RepID=UPI002103BDC1|nr:helix-turn-helix transcriptional regulator [Massilia sp. erpn]
MPTYSPDRQHPDLVAFGDAVRRLRIEKGMTQEVLAFAAELDKGYLGRVERGDSVAALLVIARIARALGVTVEQLMGVAEL